MYVFDRDVHLYFWNIECTQRKLAVDEALRANVVINIIYKKNAPLPRVSGRTLLPGVMN